MPFPDHRAIRAHRALPLFPPDPPTSTTSGDTDTTGGGGSGGGSGDGGFHPKPSSTSDTPPASSSTPAQTPSHTRGGDGRRTSSTVDTTTAETTSSETPTLTVKSSSSTTSSETPTSSSVRVVVVSSSTPSTTSKSTVVAPKTTNTFVSANGDIKNTPMTTAPEATISPSNSAVAATGNLNVGAVIGGVAGGVAGVALFFFICMFFIRRRRESNDRFDPVSFRKSAVMVDEATDPFNARPPTMIERKLNSHNVAPSISSFQGPNMAGAGAYNIEEQQYAQQYMQQQQTSHPFVHQPIQPRQQYTFGQTYEQQAYEQHGSETGHGMEYDGPYSSEPQARDIYAAEAYAYPGEGDVIVSPGMQAQEMGHHQEYQQQTHDAYGGM